MLDENTNQFIDKIAKDASVGETQEKRKTVVKKQNYAGEGAGLGSLLGAAAGAMSKRFKPLATVGGAVGGALAGKYLGKKTIGKTKSIQREGTLKRKESRDEGGSAVVPRLDAPKRLESK